LLFAPVVLDICDLSVVDGDELEDEWIASTSVVGDPVEAYDECVLGGVDEVVGSDSCVAGPSSG
jgi:hypothetical protein